VVESTWDDGTGSVIDPRDTLHYIAPRPAVWKHLIMTGPDKLTTLGWREWVLLPQLADLPIKAKVDTGAKTSALHAFYIEPYRKDGELLVKFLIHPLQNDTSTEIECHAPVIDQRMVSDSGGHKEQRFVIETAVVIQEQSFPIELTLTDRDSMLFRMLLGRSALKGRFSVDSASSFLAGGNSKTP